MKPPSIPIVDWPTSLDSALSQMQRIKIPRVIVTPMDSGPPKRRRAGADIECFTGTVQLDEEEFEDLSVLTGSRFIKIKAPDTGEELLVSFYQKPIARKTSTIVGGPTARDVEIHLAINPNSKTLLGAL